ncbi:unnamed protein product, partial [Symbiodinium sp. CCMP2456]
MVRDIMLSASGKLSDKMYGHGVFPPQPQSVTALAYGNFKWTPSRGEDRFRRSIYTFSKRTAPFAAFTVFDAPSGEVCTAKRDRSNTPLQALTLLNDGMYIELAQAMAAAAKDEADSDEAIAENLFRRLLTRPPESEELKAILQFHASQHTRLRDGELDVKAIGGAKSVDPNDADTVSPFAPKPTHFPGKAKRVIYLFMAGAPSQLELFDHKPHGQSGAEISEMLPHLSKVVDDISILRSVHTDHFNHSPAQLFCNTGNGVPGRPSMGSWLSYGLGSEANDLPSFVVLKSGGSLSGGAAMWNAGFLPSVHQGVPFRGQGDPILHVSNPPGYDVKAQRDSIDLIRQLNQRQLGDVGDPEIQTRMDAYEMAFRMQARAPELMDFSQESQETMQLYGADPSDTKKTFANNCLLARRLAERGVRFVQVYHAGWDHHSNVEGGVRSQCLQTDQACAALVEDLRRRGMLDDTLIVWGGEFGRTPMVEASAALGRSQG